MERFLILLLVGILSLWPTRASAEPRFALVIGVDDYKTLPLALPVRDARLVAARLEQVGFDATLLENPSKGEIVDAVDRLAAALTRAGPDSTALFYFSGHGVQFDGHNYLIPGRSPLLEPGPTGGPPPLSKAALIDRAVDAQSGVLSYLTETGASRIIFVLDACRSNPFNPAHRDLTHVGGLQPMQPAGGEAEVFVLFATAPMQVAYDGEKGAANSPFTSAFAEAIVRPGSTLEAVYREVRANVRTLTDGQQQPYQEGVLFESFAFRPAPPARPEGSARWAGAAEAGLELRDYDLTEDGTALLQSVLQKRSIDEIRAQAERGDAEAQYLMAVAYYGGTRVEKDVKQAVSWYRRSAAGGFARAQCMYGVRLLEGEGVQQNVEEGLEWLSMAADKGNLNAMFFLGQELTSGKRVPKDLAAAERYLERARAFGSSSATYALSNTLFARAREEEQRGEASSKATFARGLSLLEEAAKQGDLTAQWSLAQRLQFGLGVPRDPREALRWYDAAARAGDADGALGAARLLRDDTSGMRDDARAAGYLRQAGEAGSGEAFSDLADMVFEDRVPGTTRAAALVLYERAAKLGYTPAQTMLGRHLVEGDGVKADLGRGATLLVESYHTLKQAPPNTELAYPMSQQTAAYWIQAAAKKGPSPALTPALLAEVQADYGSQAVKMKKFTVPITCAAGKSTFDFYIWDSDHPENPIDDQARWLEAARGCTVAPEVITSFHKLQELALKNKVSFSELCVYALEAANKQNPPPPAGD